MTPAVAPREAGDWREGAVAAATVLVPLLVILCLAFGVVPVALTIGDVLAPLWALVRTPIGVFFLGALVVGADLWLVRRAVPDETRPDLTHIEAKDVPHVYGVVSSQWSHTEQVRWTILNNFLVACTVLAVAWATVYAGARPTDARTTCALWLLAGAGFLLSLVWVPLLDRANRFVKVYQDVLEAAEQRFPRGDQLATHQAERARKRPMFPFIQSRWVLLIVPGVFALLYVALAAITVLS